MCHGSNSLWALDEIDQALVEKPVAPGGATGGVEYEAMNYVVSLILCVFRFPSLLPINRYIFRYHVVVLVLSRCLLSILDWPCGSRLYPIWQDVIFTSQY